LKNDFITNDAAEMHSILRSASCIKRYDSISHQLLSELLVAIATEGEVVGGNNRGSDVFSSQYGKIEVKSRILGTDGPFPRVSLKPHNIEKADWFVGIRWTRDFQFHEAWMLPKSAASTLHAVIKQDSGLAHISWESWKAGPGAVDLTQRIKAVL
jgi:hypothetical protein